LSKCALIVDDSRTSRAVLRRILETHALDVDTAESAEAALEYLAQNRPDVIFMDHQMPGMDGLQAVATIKQNPAMATIPIMMYTSQKGDVYVGQARALGAVGVLPKEVEPVEVSKVLESLHIIGDEPPPSRPRAEPVETTARTGGYALPDAGDTGIRLMLEDLFDQQRAILKRDILQTSDTVAAKVAERIGPADAGPPSAPAERRDRVPAWSIVAAVAAIAIILILAVWNVSQRARLEAALARSESLSAALEREADQQSGNVDALLLQLEDYERLLADQRAALRDAITWGINRSGRYGFGEEPLGDARVPDIEQLLSRLQVAGFSGEVMIKTHVGDHCLVLMPDGYRIAEPYLPADRCDLRGYSSEEAFDVSNRQSVAMANLIASARARSNGAIVLSVMPYGSTDPIVPYPPEAVAATAGEWNTAADINNRIEVELRPDPGL
jgi:CheY-like chemotaxis protein